MLSACSFQPTSTWRDSIEESGIRISIPTNAAGAIGSLTYRGAEYIDSSDHGRLVQSAVSYDNQGANNNPTEGGSDSDGPMINPSTSQLISIKTTKSSLETTTIPALWLPIGSQVISNDSLFKRVTIGFQGHINVIQYDVTFKVTDSHQNIVFESLTGYMPAKFNTYHTLVSGVLTQITATKGGIQGDSISSTDDGKNALAIRTLDSGSYTVNWALNPLLQSAEVPCTKWSAVNVVAAPTQPNSYTFHHLIVVGTLEEVVSTLKSL